MLPRSPADRRGQAASAQFGVPVVGGHLHPDTPYSVVDVAILGIARLDSVIYSTEKTLKDNKDKFKEEDVKAAEEAVEEARKHLDGEVSVMKEQIEKLNQVAHTLAQTMYSQAQQPPGGGEGGLSSGGRPRCAGWTR